VATVMPYGDSSHGTRVRRPRRVKSILGVEGQEAKLEEDTEQEVNVMHSWLEFVLTAM
jgi:hypothetical protein